MNYWVAIIPLGVGFLWFVWNVFWQPYKMYVAQHNGFQTQLKAKDTEIITLKSILENQAQKKARQDKMSDCLLKFKNHLDTVRASLDAYGHACGAGYFRSSLWDCGGERVHSCKRPALETLSARLCQVMPGYANLCQPMPVPLPPTPSLEL